MNKKILYLMIMAFSFFMIPNSLMAFEKPPVNTHMESSEIPVEIREMIDRLNEIKSLDKSSLSRLDRKELRKEVRAIKKSVRGSGNGIYISSGAIIIILLLIIIL